MALRRQNRQDVRTILFVDAVNFTTEIKNYGRPVVVQKIGQLREFVEFCFVFRLKGQFISEMGDGFLLLCPPTPAEVIREAVSCHALISAHNHGRSDEEQINYRIAIHYGLISPPEGNNYIDTNINLAARLEGVAPRNAICISSVLHDIVADTLTSYTFIRSKARLKGLGEHTYYVLSTPPGVGPVWLTRRETRLGFYLSTIEALQGAEDHQAVRNTCEEALIDFPNNPEFMYQAGYSALLMDDALAAIRWFEQCVGLGYKVGDSHHFMGSAYRALGNHDHAQEMFLSAVREEPRHFHAMLEMAELHYSSGHCAEAGSWARKASRIAPRFFGPFALLTAIGLAGEGVLPKPKELRRLPASNHGLFQEMVAQYLRQARAVGYRKSFATLCEKAGIKKVKVVSKRARLT